MEEPKLALDSLIAPKTLAEHVATVKAQNQNSPIPKSVKPPLLQKRTVITGVVVLSAILLTVGGIFAYQAMHKPAKVTVVTPSPTPAPTPAAAPVAAPVPTTKASPLSGAQLDPALANRPITAVVIENHTDARPQSGLQDAGVVYEALAEGGITRFLAFFLEKKPASLGPVRSLRTYFVDWALEYGAPVAHAGGNADALDLVGPTGMKDMNQFAHGGNFYRTTDRYAPHNLYTSTDLLDKLEQQLGYATPATFTPNPRKADSPEATPSHTQIGLNYSYSGYQSGYTYEASSNSYLRTLAGKAHIDRNSGQQIKVKNVVVEYMNTSYGTTRIGEQTVIMGTVGTGKALVFLDGGATTATWVKASRTARTQLFDAAGKEIALNVGNTWYSIVPNGKLVTY